MPKKLKLVLQIVLFVGLGAFVVWFITKDFTPAEKEQLYKSFRDARYIYLVPVTIMLLCAHYVRALRWRILIQPLQYFPGKANTFFAVLLGYLFNLFVPRLGEVLKCTLLSRYEKVPPDKLVGTIVVERAFDVVSLITVFIITLLIQIDVAGPAIAAFFGRMTASNGGFSIWKFLAIITAIALGIVLIIWLFKRHKERSFIKSIRKIFSNIYQGLTSFRHLQQPKAFLGYTFLMWMLYLMSIRVGFYSFQPVADLHTPAALSTLTFGSLGMIAPTQNGLGAYQFAVQKTMEIYGVAPVQGMAFGWILWGAQTALLLIFGLISLALLPIVNRNKNEKTRTASAENIYPGSTAETTT